MGLCRCFRIRLFDALRHIYTLHSQHIYSLHSQHTSERFHDESTILSKCIYPFSDIFGFSISLFFNAFNTLEFQFRLVLYMSLKFVYGFEVVVGLGAESGLCCATYSMPSSKSDAQKKSVDDPLTKFTNKPKALCAEQETVVFATTNILLSGLQTL